MEEELQDHQRAQEEAMTKIQLLEQMVKALEYELEAKNHLKDDRAKQAKIMEVYGFRAKVLCDGGGFVNWIS